MRAHADETIFDREEPVDDGEPASTWRKTGTLLLSAEVCEGVGILAGMASRSSVANWYPTLEKPAFTPPAGATRPGLVRRPAGAQRRHLVAEVTPGDGPPAAPDGRAIPR